MNYKKILLGIGMTLSCYSLHAQEKPSFMNLQLGVAGSVQGLNIETPAIYGSYEYYISDGITIGAIAGYSSLTRTETVFNQGSQEVETKTSNVVLGALANYYFTSEGKFKPYLGTSLGYSSGLTGKFLFEAHAGAKYQIAESFDANAELGFGLSLLKIGITFKL